MFIIRLIPTKTHLVEIWRLSIMSLQRQIIYQRHFADTCTIVRHRRNHTDTATCHMSQTHVTDTTTCHRHTSQTQPHATDT